MEMDPDIIYPIPIRLDIPLESPRHVGLSHVPRIPLSIGGPSAFMKYERIPEEASISAVHKLSFFTFRNFEPISKTSQLLSYSVYPYLPALLSPNLAGPTAIIKPADLSPAQASTGKANYFPQLIGAPLRTNENAKYYELILEKYQRFRRKLTRMLVEPDVLTEGTPEYDRRLKAAMENARKVEVYQDEKNVFLTTLFNPEIKVVPQMVNAYSSVFHHFLNYGISKKERHSDLVKKWDVISRTRNQEYWDWIMFSSKVQDEHLKQREMGFIKLRKASNRKRKMEFMLNK